MVNIIQYALPESFLQKTRPAFEEDEAAHNLMLGLSIKLVKNPKSFSDTFFLATVEEGKELLLACLMTPPHNLLVYGHGSKWKDGIEPLAHFIREKFGPIPGVNGPVEISTEFSKKWSSLTGQRAKQGLQTRAFKLSKVIPPPSAPGHFRQATPLDLPLTEEWIQGFHLGAHLEAPDRAKIKELAKSGIENGNIYFWEDARTVSMAAKNRPTPNVTGVSLVYTPEELRGKGYASNLVANLSQLILSEGKKYCALFTNQANPVSNSIYMKIGYLPVEDFCEYQFEKV